MVLQYTDFINNWQEAMFGGFVGGIIATFLAGAIIFSIAVYVYHAFAWMTIAKKQKYKNPWLAWIPFAESAMRLQLGKFHWAWIFLLLIPIAGWIALIVLVTIATWRIFEKEKYEGWLSLSYPLIFMLRASGIGFVAYMIAIGMVAWRKPLKKSSRKK